MNATKLGPHDNDPTDSPWSDDERSFNRHVDDPEKTRQDYYTLDKVYYQDKIWEVKQVDWINKKGSKKKPYWNYLLRLEDGDQTVTVEQKHITEIAVDGPNRPK